MHILVTNDDGPPSEQSSPYVLPFVRTLEAAGHTVSVILPHTQRSWIGKAHIVGQDVSAHYYFPDKTHPAGPSSSPETEDKLPWVLVNSTPASCSQLGLFHVFKDRPPVDLVISGPNYGRNTTAVFALSSGTLGAALEASVCGYKSIALSFAFFDRENDPQVVAGSCRQSVKVIEWLAKHGEWDDGRVFSVNVPNSWGSKSCFEEMPRTVEDPETEEAELRRQESQEDSSGNRTGGGKDEKWKPHHFKWAPKFQGVHDSVFKAGPGSDGWAVKEGQTSVTALRANFMHIDGFAGDIKL
ncbi:hypothetical protein H2203_008698 [Taxawa tesnikishii (nom. ined.)]|nr:hypothetical protein H2203_008698 [Dothideales sp. JES 119]